MKNKTFYQSFELSSDIRLPFQPKKEALALREKIRRNLKRFVSQKYNHLNALLASNEQAFFDVENVLFYNVGAGAFAHLMLDEISFALEKSADGQEKKYKYFYGLCDEKSSSAESATMVEFSFCIDKMTSDMKPLDYWHAFKQGEIKLIDSVNPKEFGLFVNIIAPQKNRNLSGIIKPLLDGIIAAFHYQNLVDQKVLVSMAEKLQIDRELVLQELSCHGYEILGERHLVSSYRKGIKWNPEDEKCTKVNIRQKQAPIETITISGKVVHLLPKNQHQSLVPDRI